jgi:6-phosphogluconolactonase
MNSGARAIGWGIMMMAMLIGCSSTPGQSGSASAPPAWWVYVGGNGKEGIHLYKFDMTTTALADQGIAGPAIAPGFMAIAPNKKFMYSVATIDGPNHQPIGGVAAFSIDATTGKLTPINEQSSQGEDPCFVAVDPLGKNALVANYNSATVAVLPIDASGKLAPATCTVKQTGSSTDPTRQTHAYAHSINLDPAGKFAFVCDLGADKIFIYNYDSAAGQLTAAATPFVTLPPGSGPRHFTFHPNGKFAYVVNEMGGTVVAYSYNADKGELTQLQLIHTLPSDFSGTNTSAEVQIHPNGKFLYASNRLGTNFLTIFSLDPNTGMLTLVGYQPSLGKTPRNFRLDPTGTFLIVANQDSNNVVVFRIDQNTGKLTPTGTSVDVPTPTCVKFLGIESAH